MTLSNDMNSGVKTHDNTSGGRKDAQSFVESATRIAQLRVSPSEDDYQRSLDRRSADRQTIDILAFSVRGVDFAFYVDEAIEVLRMRQLTDVPNVPAYIRGFFSLRGEMVPVIDVAARIGLPAHGGAEAAARILVSSVADVGKVGFLADELTGVSSVPGADMSSGTVKPSGSKAFEIDPFFSMGAVECSGRVRILLDPEALCAGHSTSDKARGG